MEDKKMTTEQANIMGNNVNRGECVQENWEQECVGDETTKLQNEQPHTTEKDVETDNVAPQKEPLWQERYESLNDTHLRLMAEFDNYRKRTMREKAELIRGGNEVALKALLPVIDDVERAISNIREVADIVAVKEGIELIYGKFRTYLTQQGISEIEVIGQSLNTETSEAVTSFPAPQEDMRGKVIDCIQKGYKLNDKVIRHAKVVVAES